MPENLLKVDQITMRFGGLKAIDNVSFEVQKGQLAGLIGPNGAGKTTMFNILTGVYKPTTGNVLLNNQKIQGLKPFQISQKGISRTFQNIRLFKELTVLENLLVAFHQHVIYSPWDALFQTKKFLTEEENLKKKSLELLQIFQLDHKSHLEAGNLPYGDQRKIEILRALATKPELILLDEPAAGMNHQETHELMKIIDQIRKDFNVTVLLIEHDMKLVMGICEQIFVLDHGVKIEEGNAQHVRNSKKVIEAYLGTDKQDLGY